MFEIGERIIYGKTGVCTVEEISEKQIGSSKRMYYTLRPLYKENNVIYAPADSDKIFMRPLITRAEAEALISHVAEIRDAALEVREEAEPCDGHSCEELLATAVRIYEKKCEARRLKRKLGFTYEKQLTTAEQLLFGELAAVLDKSVDEIPALLFAGL